MISDLRLAEAIIDSVTPTEGELFDARQRFLHRMSSQPSCVVGDLEADWLISVGGQLPSPHVRDERPMALSTNDGYVLIEATDNRLLLEKARRVTAIVLSDLIAEGVIVQSIGDNYRTPVTNMSVAFAGFSDSIEIPDEIPQPLSRQARVRLREGGELFDAILSTEDSLQGLERVLGVRGERTIREARAAISRRLYLAGASLLAAASEAAWFTLGRAVPRPNSALRKSLENGRDVSIVIEAVTKHARDHGLLTTTRINEILADAHHLRDIRNYALHPVDELDSDREAWLSEAGCAVLVIASRRYFVRLAQLLDALETSLAAESATPVKTS